jgi:SAM-dependent methyltransferase
VADNPVFARELAYHEQLYSGFAQQHFAKPAVRALRRHMAGRIRRLAQLTSASHVLSVGCGIADTELLLAPHVREIVCLDLSPKAIQHARLTASQCGLRNMRFVNGLLGETPLPVNFDAIIGIFVLHHLPDDALAAVPQQAMRLLAPGGRFYSLDPSRYRLSGKIGEWLFPELMRRYQTPDERELDPVETANLFARAGLECRTSYYDLASSPLAGLLPDWPVTYRAARFVDEALVRTPVIQRWGSNFELLARKPESSRP